jgi:hypothetical protein
MPAPLALWLWMKFSTNKILFGILAAYALSQKKDVQFEYKDRLSSFRLEARDKTPPPP